MFSLLPRCQGEWGSQTYTGIRTVSEKFLWRAISWPWSHVRDFRMAGGTAPKAAATAEVTAPEGGFNWSSQHPF